MILKIHSATDLITNSSTVIFTYSDGAEAALKEMVEEIFKTFGISLKFEEVFDSVVLCEDDYHYVEFIEDLDEDELPEGITTETTSAEIRQLYEDVVNGRVKKPDWFETVENKEDVYDYFKPANTLCIIPKKEEYKKLAQKIERFLYSTDHEATRDG